MFILANNNAVVYILIINRIVCRMKTMCEEAKDSGIKTLVMLDDQGEQLEKFETGVDGINADMRLAEEALKSMDLLCGIFPKFWKKSGGFKEDDAIWGDQKVRKKGQLSPR